MPSHVITYRLALFVRIGSVAASAAAGLMSRRVGEQRFVSLVSGPPGKDTKGGGIRRDSDNTRALDGYQCAVCPA
jgi:hypothetical protein